jgi:hypothetical protein
MSGISNVVNRASFSKSGSLRNRFFATAKFTAIPSGYVHPYTWAMAQVSGGLASHKQLSATLSETKALSALGINVEAALSASLVESNAVLALIVALQANLDAGGSFTDANMAIILLLQANLSAGGIYTDAQLNIIVGMIASLSASGSISNSITNQVNLSADIGGPVELSPQGLAEELLDNQDIETGYSMRESLRVILSALSGKLSGAGSSGISIRDVNDTVDRIIATVDANGNRTAITITKD